MNIRKVVIPVAGWGTRSLPASKNIPKEMLPIYNKPVIQYVVEEAMHSGVTDVVFVTNREKSVIEDHFDYNLQLESVLERSGKKELLAKLDPSLMSALQELQSQLLNMLWQLVSSLSVVLVGGVSIATSFATSLPVPPKWHQTLRQIMNCVFCAPSMKR